MAQLLLRGERLGAVRAVLFDKDGTLSHSEPGLTRLSRARVAACLERVEPDLRSSLQPLIERAYGLIGDRLHPAGTTAVASRQHNLISTATAFCQVGLGWPQALSHSEAVFAATDPDPDQNETDQGLAPTTDALIPLLESLSSAGLILGVISNDDSAGIERFLAGHGLRNRIDGIWSADHQPAKPDPEAVHRFCDQLGVTPDACALIGDADTDLTMALNAGVPLALGYTAGWSLAPELREGHPLIHHWSELGVLPEGPATP